MRLAWMVVALGGCLAGSGAGGGGDCASTEDCSGDEECLGPNAPQACGIPPQEGCAAAADCGTGTTCHAIYDACSFDGIGSQCGSRCDTPYGACGTDFACVDGACVAVSCEDGYPCPAHQVCDPTAIGADAPAYDRHHGCVDVACSDDAACPDGACVNGICQDGPGSCEVPQLVP